MTCCGISFNANTEDRSAPYSTTRFGRRQSGNVVEQKALRIRALYDDGALTAGMGLFYWHNNQCDQPDDTVCVAKPRHTRLETRRPRSELRPAPALMALSIYASYAYGEREVAVPPEHGRTPRRGLKRAGRPI